MKNIKTIIIGSSFGALLLLTSAHAAPVPECKASTLSEWMSCKSKLESGTIKNIQVEGEFTCSANDRCALGIHGKSNVNIWSDNGATIKRTGNFSEAIISIVNSDMVEVKNIKFEESPNVPVQPTPKAQEVNRPCMSVACSSPISIYQATNVTIDKVNVNHGKVFGILISKTRNVKITNSIIQNAWWFGIWGSENHNITYYKNQFLNNRSNGILTGTSLTDETRVIENLFSGNHHATAFHTCGNNGTEPCPGGQIDLVDPVRNVTVEGNIFENSKMSGEFPEDVNHNWIAGIEFEAGKHGIFSTYIRNNIIRNNSGSPFYINLPAPEVKDTFAVDMEVSGNTICNNRTKDYHDPKVTWGGGIKLFDNNFSCTAPPAPLRGSISTTTCTVASASGMCQATVTWSAPDHAGACVFAGNVLWACDGKSMTKTLNFASVNPLDLILRTGNSTSAQEIARVTLQAKLATTTPVPTPTPTPTPTPAPTPAPTPTVTNKGLGCSDMNCIYLVGPNLAKGMYIDIRNKDTSAMLKGNVSTNYVKNSETEHVLTFVIPPEVRDIFKTTGFNLYVVDPANKTWSKPIYFKRP